MNAPRRTQAERRAQTRSALLEAAARGLSTHGFATLSLEQVAREAGYTRGALYHHFPDKEELALAVVEWVAETWWAEVGHLLIDPGADADPVATLLALARGHAIYCRRDIAAVLMTLRVEFAGQEHAVGRTIMNMIGVLRDRCTHLIAVGRTSGEIPAGPPSADLALAVIGTLESVPIQLTGRAPYDAELCERAVRGLLGLSPA